MNLGRSILRPGKVVEVVDNYGTIKATSPGLFSVDDDPSLLPPIIPFLATSSGSFTSPVEGDTIWIMRDSGNSQLLFYFRFNQLPYEVKKILDSGDTNQEIVFSRDTEKGVYQLFFNDGTGIKMMKDDSYILIKPDGCIDIVTNKASRSISLSGDSICLGADSEGAGKVTTHAAYGEKVEAAVNTIYNILKLLQTLCSTSPYTTALAPAFALVESLGEQIAEITSNDVKII